MLLKRNEEIINSAMKNTFTEVEYFKKLLNIAIARFKWTGLPESIDPRYLEIHLVLDSNVLFFQDKETGVFLTLPLNYDSRIDVYGIPYQRGGVGDNGKQFLGYDPSNSVIIFDRLLHDSEMPLIKMYACRLWEVYRSFETNVALQKYSGAIVSNEKQALSLKNIFMKWDGNQPIIPINKNIDVDAAFRSLGFNVPFLADKLMQIEQNIYNQALTSLGIYSGRNEKRERENVIESTSLFESVLFTRNSLLESRKQACEQINKLFGLSVDVDFNSAIGDSIELGAGKVVNELEPIHNNISGDY